MPLVLPPCCSAAAVLYAKEAKAKKEAGEDVNAFIAEKEEEYNELFANPYPWHSWPPSVTRCPPRSMVTYLCKV